MDRQVIWTESVWRDLEEAADYIARDSPYYAAAFVSEARAAAGACSLMHLGHNT